MVGDKTVRIAVAMSDPNYLGGANKVTSSVIEILKRRGHEVALCTLFKPSRGKCFQEYLELQDVYLPTLLSKAVVKGKLLKNVIQLGSAINDCIKKFKPHIVVCFDEPGCFRGIKDSGVAKVLYVHFPTEIKAVDNSLLHLVYRIPYWYWHYQQLPTLHAVVCNSQYTRQITYALYQYVLPEKWKYHVIYPPVNIQEFKKPAKKENKICYVGRIDMHKGIDYIVESYLRICKEVDVQLEIVGGVTESPWSRGYYEKHFKPYISKLQDKYPISVKVNVPYREVVETLLTSKVMMSYNPEEHFGIVPVEAQAAGCIPIVADGGGQRETVIHGEVGFRVQHPYELDKYVKKILFDDDLRARISEKAKKWAENFSFDSIGNMWESLLDKLRGEG